MSAPAGSVVLVSGASSGFGSMIVRELADAGHTVYAGMRATTGRNAPAVAAAREHAEERGVDLRTVELDVGEQASTDAAVAQVLRECGRVDVVVHNAGPWCSARPRRSRPSSCTRSST